MIDGKRKYLKDAVMDKTSMKIDLLGKVRQDAKGVFLKMVLTQH